MLVTLALSVLAGLTFATDRNRELATFLPPLGLAAIAGVIAVVAYVDSILWTLERRVSASQGLWVLLGLAFLAVLGSSSSLNSSLGSARALNTLSEFASGWMLGGTLTAMLLGHWYLTATGMKLVPLIQLNQWAGAATFLRGVLAAIGLACLGLDRLTTTDYVWLTLRWAGLVGPLLMVFMVIRILRYRNTQSATGVLYASTILVFMGETAAMLLARSQDFSWWL